MTMMLDGKGGHQDNAGRTHNAAEASLHCPRSLSISFADRRPRMPAEEIVRRYPGIGERVRRTLSKVAVRPVAAVIAPVSQLFEPIESTMHDLLARYSERQIASIAISSSRPQSRSSVR